MKNILMVIHGLKFTNGGITKVMLNRSHFFSERGHRVSLVTFDDEENYFELEKKFKESERLHENASIINFFDYYREKNSRHKTDIQIESPIFSRNNIWEDGLLIQHEYFERKKYVRYFKPSGELVKCKTWSENNRVVEKIDFYENTNLVRTEYYRDNSLVKTVDYDALGKDIQFRYFTTDGFCFLQRSFLGEKKMLHLFLFDRQKNEVIGFNSYRKMHTYFLEELCVSSRKKDNIVICDGPGSSVKVADISSSKAVKILTIHSNHLAAPYTKGAPIKEGLTGIFESLDKVDKIIVLTKLQQNDLIEHFKRNDKFYYIPNTVPAVDDFDKNSIFEEKIRKINILSRYVGMKRLKDTINAINILITKKKVARDRLRVNFYGDGPQKEELLSYVDELNLADVISVNGYATDVDYVLKTAHITIMTSLYEGAPMALIEAMSNKTPVISYDINYGPKDVITPNIDGFLVTPNDINGLSDIMYEVLFDRFDRLPEISNNAFNKIMTNYTHENAVEEWIKVINSFNEYENK